MDTAFLLIALGFGFKILIEALKQDTKILKFLGVIIAIFMIVVSACGALCKTCSSVGKSSKCAFCIKKGGDSQYSSRKEAFLKYHGNLMKESAEEVSAGS